MKTRTDFVSNSSSSSFILKDVGFFSFFGITKQDILDAITELYGGKESVDKLVNDEIAKLEKEIAKPDANDESNKWHTEYCTERLEELKTKGLNYWCVYDMADEKDREECFKEWDKHFSYWVAPNEGEPDKWDNIVEVLKWTCGFDNIEDVVNGNDDVLIATAHSRGTGLTTEVKFPDGVKLVRYIKDKLGVKSMKEVLHDKKCTMMIHFADNEVHALDGMQDYGKEDANDYRDDEHNAECEASKWDSRMYSADRFFEVLIKYFIEKGKINLEDPDFLEYWRIRDDDEWFKKNHPGRKYYLADDKATWKDVVDDMLGCNAIMHEG